MKFKTLGCRLNTFETETIKSITEKLDFKNLTFVNTCSVTKEASKNSKKYVRQLKKSSPQNTVIVSGTHLVYYKNKFIFVSQHPDAIKTNIKTDFLYCLITSNHLIPIQNIIFHDWEDNHKV
mgnify:CR=1 FL=1